jgi:hypothetical protein
MAFLQAYRNPDKEKSGLSSLLPAGSPVVAAGGDIGCGALVEGDVPRLFKHLGLLLALEPDSQLGEAKPYLSALVCQVVTE